MLNFKNFLNCKTILLVTICAGFSGNVNAQFYDLNDNQNEYRNDDVSDHPIFADKEQNNPELETSGDDGGFIPEQNPDFAEAEPKSFMETIPVANGIESFSVEIAENEVSEKFRTMDQLDYIGFLNANFDEGLWKGVTFEGAERRLSKIAKSDIGSIHIKKIFTDMLMAKARPPQTPEGRSWLLLRLKTLMEMGKLSNVHLLMKEIRPNELIALNDVNLNNMFLASSILDPNATEVFKQIVTKDPNNVGYRKMFMIKLFNEGKIGSARLSSQALKDSNPEFKTTRFSQMFDAILASKKVNLSDQENLDIYEQYLVAISPDSFMNVDYSRFEDKILLDASRNAKSQSLKIEIAEILMNTYPYSYNVDNLNQFYESYEFSQKELSVPLKFIQSSDDEFKNRALLYQSSRSNEINSTKALALKKLWESYEQSNLRNIKLLITEKTQGISVNSSIAWFSQDILKGQLQHASIEYNTLKTLYENIDQVYANPEFAELQIALEFLKRTTVIGMNFGSVQDYKETLVRWFNSKTIDSGEDYKHMLTVLTLLDALNSKIPDIIWSRMYDKSDFEKQMSDANPIWIRLVSSSIERREVGNSLLLVIESFANKEPKDLNPQTLANIVACLNFLNMSQEMALVGMEAILPQ